MIVDLVLAGFEIEDRRAASHHTRVGGTYGCGHGVGQGSGNGRGYGSGMGEGEGSGGNGPKKGDDDCPGEGIGMQEGDDFEFKKTSLCWSAP